MIVPAVLSKRLINCMICAIMKKAFGKMLPFDDLHLPPRALCGAFGDGQSQRFHY